MKRKSLGRQSIRRPIARFRALEFELAFNSAADMLSNAFEADRLAGITDDLLVMLDPDTYPQQQFELAVAFARLCLPQIFFYGLYTMLSQVLNARGHFGMPMFAPIANNVIAIATFGLFLAIAGTTAAADGSLTSQQVFLLGIGKIGRAHV